MKATIIDTHHTIQIDQSQVDIIYSFSSGTLECYIDGNHFIRAKFNPARMMLSYSNVLHVGVFYFEQFQKSKNKNDQANKLE